MAAEDEELSERESSKRPGASFYKVSSNDGFKTFYAQGMVCTSLYLYTYKNAKGKTRSFFVNF